MPRAAKPATPKSNSVSDPGSGVVVTPEIESTDEVKLSWPPGIKSAAKLP